MNTVQINIVYNRPSRAIPEQYSSGLGGSILRGLKMLTTATDRHHSVLPAIGEIGYLVAGHNRYGEINYWHGRRQRFQVVAYPLCDNVQPYSVGIHTAFFRNLRNNRIVRMSGFYFENAN